jgi:hypothetical protein
LPTTVATATITLVAVAHPPPSLPLPLPLVSLVTLVTVAIALFVALAFTCPPPSVETLADPYKGRIPLPSVPNYQEQDLSRHLIQTGTNTPPNGQEAFPNGERMKLFFPTIVTE